MTFYISSDYITSGANEAYSALFIDIDGYELTSSGVLSGKTWDSSSGFIEFDANKVVIGFGSGTLGNVKDTILTGTKFGIFANENNVYAIVSGVARPFEEWGSGSSDATLRADLYSIGDGFGAKLIAHHYDSDGSTVHTVHDMFEHVTPNWLLQGGELSSLGGLTISWTEGHYNNIYSNDVKSFESGSATLTDNAVNYLYIDYANEGLGVQVSTTFPNFNHILLGRVSCVNGSIYRIHQENSVSFAFNDGFKALKDLFPEFVKKGLIVEPQGVTALAVKTDGGEYYENMNVKVTVPSIDSTVTLIRRWYHDASGNWVSDTSSTIDTVNYDTGTGLAALPVNKYVKSLFIVSPTEIHWIYPQEYFNNFADAVNGALPNIPDGLSILPKSIALITQEGDTELPPFPSDAWIDVRTTFSIEYTKPNIIDHGDLAGLTDDDHPQYHTDGRADTWLSGKTTDNIVEGTTNLYYTDERVDDRVSNLLVAGSNISLTYDDVANTLTIAVDEVGLNADTLDGYDSSYFAALSENETITGDWTFSGSTVFSGSVSFSGSTVGIDHNDLKNIGVNSHTDIDNHISDSSIHFTESSIDHGNLLGLNDDDHPQYAHLGQDETISGSWNFSNTLTISAQHLKLTHGSAYLSMDNTGDSGKGIKKITCNDGGGNWNFRGGCYYNSGYIYETTNNGATAIEQNFEGCNGEIYLKVAVSGTAGNTFSWDNFLVITPYAMYVNKLFRPYTDGGADLGTTSNRWNKLISKSILLSDALDITLQPDDSGYGASLGIYNATSGKTIRIGAGNTTYAHLTTDANSGFWFGNNVAVNGNITPYSDNIAGLGSSNKRWATIYSNDIINTNTITIGSPPTNGGIIAPLTDGLMIKGNDGSVGAYIYDDRQWLTGITSINRGSTSVSTGYGLEVGGDALFDNSVDIIEDLSVSGTIYEGGASLSSKYASISHTHALDDLSDVNISSLSDGQVLVYDSGTGNWINGDAGTGDISQGTNVTTGYIPKWESTGVLTDSIMMEESDAIVIKKTIATDGFVLVNTTTDADAYSPRLTLKGNAWYNSTNYTVLSWLRTRAQDAEDGGNGFGLEVYLENYGTSYIKKALEISAKNSRHYLTLYDGDSDNTKLIDIDKTGIDFFMESAQYGITYKPTGDTDTRYGLFFDSTNKVVALCNRTANGYVELRANDGTAGASGEDVILRASNDKVNIYRDMEVMSWLLEY